LQRERLSFLAAACILQVTESTCSRQSAKLLVSIFMLSSFAAAQALPPAFAAFSRWLTRREVASVAWRWSRSAGGFSGVSFAAVSSTSVTRLECHDGMLVANAVDRP